MNIKELEKQIIGGGEVKGLTYNQKNSSQHAYIYEAINEAGKISHYEVFERKNSPVCIDFESRVYSETEFKESYPKSNSFGIWAWTANTLDSANNRFYELNIKLEEKAKDIYYCNRCHAMFDMECVCN